MATTAQFLGERPFLSGTIRIFRLSDPLPNHGPNYRNIAVVNGSCRQDDHYIVLAAAYERADGSWAPSPRGSWSNGIAYQGDWPWIEAALKQSGFEP